MSNIFKAKHNLWFHVIISTVNRLPIILPENEKRILQLITECFRNQKFHIEAINGVKEHVHLLVRVPADICLTDSIEKALTESQILINTELFPAQSFGWHDEYAVFSVSQSQAVRVLDYIRQQQQVHVQKTFLKEWKEFLEVHGI
ncbi:MAG: transposase [Bacteroidales bacterium]